MLRKVISALMLAGCALCATVGVCAAGAPDQLELAQNYEKDGYFRQAESVYRKLVTDNKDIDEALAARKNLALLYVRMDRFDAFSCALARPIEDSSEHEGLLDTLYDVVRRYRYGCANGRPGNAVEAWFTHQQIQRFANHPETGRDLLAVRAMNAMILVEMEKAAGAEAINALIVDFPGDADLPRALWYIAERYTHLQQYDRAKGIYEAIVANCLQTNWAGRAEPMIPAMELMPLIKSSDNVRAKTAIAELIADFMGHPGLPGSIHCIAAEYEESQEYKRARDLYSTIAAAYPDTDHELTSLRNLAIVHFLMAEDAEAQGILDELIRDFSEHAALPETFNHIAEKCVEARKYEQASAVYRRIVQRFPDSPQTRTARLEAVETHIIFLIQSGEDDEANQAIEELLANFSGYPGLLGTLDHLAGWYEALDKPDKTISICKRLIDIAPDSERAADVQRVIGWTYHRRGEYDRAIDEYRKVLNDYPESVHCASSQYWIGQSFLKKHDYELALRAYERTVRTYPDSRHAVYSRINIALVYSRLRMYDKAIRDRRAIVEDYPDSGWAADAQWDVARAYDSRRDYGQAILEYRRVIELYPHSKAAGHAAKSIVRIKEYLAR